MTINFDLIVLEFCLILMTNSTPAAGDDVRFVRTGTNVCLPGHSFYNGKCYHVYTANKTFDDAETLCRKLNRGHLAVYHSEEDFNFLTKLAQGHKDVWVGAKEQLNGNNDPSLVTFTDGTTHDHVPPNLLNDGFRCIRLHLGQIWDQNCMQPYYFMCMSTSWIEQEIRYCPQDFVPFQARCYRLFTTRSSFSEAELTCNSREGHLAAFHSTAVYEFLARFTVGYNEVWLGARCQNDVYRFTDGSTYDHDVVNKDVLTGECLTLTESNGVNAESCEQSLPFICMVESYAVAIDSDKDPELQNMLDNDPATCANTTELLPSNGLYATWINFTASHNHGFIALRVMWESGINCGRRKVLYKRLENDGCSRLRPCKLVTTDAVLTSSCEYQCSCEETGCNIIYFDSQQHYREQPVDVCGLEILNTI